MARTPGTRSSGATSEPSGRFAWSFQTTAADRDDIFQCTWMRAIERLYQLRDPDRIHVWLMQIARHEALALLRRQGRLVPVGDPDDQVEHPIDAEVAEHNERLRMARRAGRRSGGVPHAHPHAHGGQPHLPRDRGDHGLGSRRDLHPAIPVPGEAAAVAGDRRLPAGARAHGRR